MIMRIIGIKTPLFEEKGNLLDFVCAAIPTLAEGDIVVITSKIVALAQGRVGVIEKKNAYVEKNAKRIIETPWALLTLTEDGWCINAGVDESNADNKLILLPRNPFAAAETMRKALIKRFSVDRLGVLITDTRSVPLRVGTIGRAIAYAGFNPLRSYVGKKDLFGRKSRVTVSNVVDALAAGAVLAMGEGDERMPIALIKDAPVQFVSLLQKKYKRLAMPPETDIFSGVFTESAHASRTPSTKKRRRR